MARRSPARFLAPLALVGFVVALLVVVNGDDATTAAPAAGGAKPAASARRRPRPRSRRRASSAGRYKVKPGDTPSSIAEKTDVPLSQIQELNPKLDDQTLSVGQKIKLRP